MKDLIRKLLKEGLEEAYPSGHFKDESYIERISGAINYNPSGKYLDWRKLNKEHFNTEYHKNGFTLDYLKSLAGKPFNNLPKEHKPEIDKRLDFIKSIEFNQNESKNICVWLYTTPKDVRYWPHGNINYGKNLAVIIDKNRMATLFWSKKRFTTKQDNFHIWYDELQKMVNSKYYNQKTKPISIKSVLKWREENPGNTYTNKKMERKKKEKDELAKQKHLSKFRKEKLTDGTMIKWYFNANRVTTMDNKELNIDDIYDRLPEEILNKIVDLLENKVRK